MSLDATFPRRLISLGLVLAALSAAACSDAPTAAAPPAVELTNSTDQAQILDPNTPDGARITVGYDRWVQVMATSSRNARVLGTQGPNAQGSITGGPSRVTSREPYPLWRINFDTGVDGWVLGTYLLALVTTPPPVTVAVASVSIVPALLNLVTGVSSQLTATLRDASGNTLTGRTISWASLNSGVATVNGTGLVTAVSAGQALVSATSEGRSGTSTVTVTQDVVVPPPTGDRGLVFTSDFSTALGTSSTALRDGTRWSLSGGQGLEVITASGLGFPTTNVLRVTAVQATTGYAFLRKTGLPIPAVGESNYYRWYFRATMPDGLEDQETHPFQDGNASSQSNWLFHVYHDAGAGRWRPQLRPSTQTNAYPNDRWSGPALLKGATYRFEVQIARTGTNTFQMNARIYDQAGTLLHQSNAFTNQTGTATLASNPTFNFLQLANLEGLNAGNNGIAGTPSWPFVYGYQAAIAVCRTTWCGVYQAGEGR